MSKWKHQIEKLEFNVMDHSDKIALRDRILDKHKIDLDEKENTLRIIQRYINVFLPIQV